ncbi:hypothetical protein BAMA_16140 [Bacillus manliponensis]|uniref:Uncharacterized protein n=1 Tax=Bacillus manliponensis TaxID=574376 RepID=A0A073K4R0_9BACI|nr:hypothetical protein [Bacillus manliponensis]KEK17273.1 hypothetical protein BAMA_16140 [Bacillus manliponensis]
MDRWFLSWFVFWPICYFIVHVIFRNEAADVLSFLGVYYMGMSLYYAFDQYVEKKKKEKHSKTVRN